MDSSDFFMFHQNDHMSSSFYAFREMREKGEFLDFTISLGNRSFTGHRLVLAAAIPYFLSIFTSDQKEITLKEIDQSALESLIDFAYSGKIKTTSENTRSLLLASKYLNMAQLNKACCKFLERNLRTDNVWYVRAFAETHVCEELVHCADDFIRQHFEEFSKSKCFAALPFLYLKETVSRDDLKVKSEEHVFEAVIRWVKASPDERRDHFPDLLELVRMPHLSQEYLMERVSKEELIKSSFRCRDLVDEAKLYHWMPGKRPEVKRFVLRPRIYDKETLAVIQEEANTDRWGIYAILASKREFLVQLLDTENNKWMSLSVYNDDFKIRQYVVISLSEMIYIFLENTIITLDIKNLTWNILDAFHESLLETRAVSHHNRIYFFDGFNNESPKVRCFDPQSNEWQTEDKMTRPLRQPGVASLAQFIYVTGGFTGWHTYKTVERYDPDIKQWSEVSPMLLERYDHGCTSLNARIYVCGGVSDERVLILTVSDTTEVYDSVTNQWSFVSPMKRGLRNLEFVPINGKIYAGRHTEILGHKSSIQIYNPELNEWKFCSPRNDSDVRKYHFAFLVSAPMSEEYDRTRKNM